MGRGRREFRSAARLGCELICPGKASPGAADQSRRGRGGRRSRARGLAPPSREGRERYPARSPVTPAPSPRLTRACEARGGRWMTVQNTAHSASLPSHSKRWALGFSQFPVLPTAFQQFAPSTRWRGLELFPSSWGLQLCHRVRASVKHRTSS